MFRVFVALQLIGIADKGFIIIIITHESSEHNLLVRTEHSDLEKSSFPFLTFDEGNVSWD